MYWDLGLLSASEHPNGKVVDPKIHTLNARFPSSTLLSSLFGGVSLIKAEY